MYFQWKTNLFIGWILYGRVTVLSIFACIARAKTDKTVTLPLLKILISWRANHCIIQLNLQNVVMYCFTNFTIVYYLRYEFYRAFFEEPISRNNRNNRFWVTQNSIREKAKTFGKDTTNIAKILF